jgi:multiple sugar transport system permease protein
MADSHAATTSRQAGRIGRPVFSALAYRRLNITVFLLPAFGLLAFLFVYPLTFNIYVSSLDWTLRQRVHEFIGLANYVDVLTDPAFWKAAKATVFWTLGSVIPQFIIGFGLALILREDIPFRGLFRTLLFLPWVSPAVVTGIMFRWMYNPQLGVVNQLLVRVGILSDSVGWLSEPGTALIAVTIANVWQGYAFSMFTMLSAMTTIPRELEEAATIDGANYVQRLQHIIVPWIRPVMVTVIMLGLIWTTNAFALIWVMTQGGPIDTTTIFPVLIYKTAFTHLYFGRAAAVSLITFVFVSILSLVYLKTLFRGSGGEK